MNEPSTPKTRDNPANQTRNTSAAASGQPGDALASAPRTPDAEIAVPRTKRVLLINRQPQKLIVNVRGPQGEIMSVELNARSRREITVHDDGELGPDVPIKIRRGVLQVVAVNDPPPEAEEKPEEAKKPEPEPKKE